MERLSKLPNPVMMPCYRSGQKQNVVFWWEEMVGRGAWGGWGRGMQRSLDDFAPPNNSSVASIHGVPCERVRNRRETSGIFTKFTSFPQLYFIFPIKS